MFLGTIYIQKPLSTSDLTPRSTHLSSCLLNIPDTSPRHSNSSHAEKNSESCSPPDLVQLLCSHFAHRHSHPHSKQPRQKPSNCPGVRLSLLCTVCPTTLPDSCVFTVSFLNIVAFPHWPPCLLSPIPSHSPHAIRAIFLISEPTLLPLTTLQ